MKLRRMIALLATGAIFATMLTGCGKEQVADDEKLTYWMPLGQNAASVVSNYGDTEFAKELEKETGIEVEYIHPAVGQESEAFNLMIASGSLPDIIEYNWLSAMGGPENSIDEGIITELNDVFKKYAPNLSKYLSEHKDVARLVKTDSGKYYVFPFIKGDEELLLTTGPIVRNDWLEELGIEEPKTVDDWEKMLIAFKEKKNATAPLTFSKDEKPYMFIMLGTNYYSYVEDGKIKYGPYQPEFKAAIETLAKWYKEGLLDKNYLVNDATIRESNIINGKSGATVAPGGSGLGKWLQNMEGKAFSLKGIQFPNEIGKNVNRFVPLSSKYGSYGAAISADCKNIEKAAKFLDYAFSKKGHMLFNFGIEGESYTMENGVPTYTDYILHNEEGLTVSQAMARYNRANYQGAFVQDKLYIEGYYALPEQKEALANWRANADYKNTTVIPQTTKTLEESEEIANISTEISKYVDQAVTEFITGQRSMDTYDSYLADLKKMGVEKMQEISQQAYDRYMKR